MTIIFLGIAWCLGIWLAAASGAPPWLWLAGGLVSLVLAAAFRGQKQPRIWLASAGFLCLGAARYGMAVPPIGSPETLGHVAYYNGLEDVVVSGVVANEPIRGDSNAQLQLAAESIRLADGRQVPVEGRVLVVTGRFPIIPYGAHLQASGRLQAPANDPEFSYRDYLARQGIHSQMVYPRLTVLGDGGGQPFHQAILAVKERARGTIQRLLPDPQAALLTGILLGDDSGMPPDLEEQFRVTGLTHIIAISGFNIAILAGILLAVGRPLFGHRRSAWFALAGIGLYTVLVGAEASVVRAAIMGGLFIVAARLMGRPTFVPAGLFTAAIVMTLINPLILWDVGFQLSFAATLGLMLYVGPWSQWTETKLQRFVPEERARPATRFLAEVVLATLAAMLLTLPIIAYYFGQLSLISPVANLFVLPAQPGVMTWGGLATLAGMVVPAVGQLFAWVAWLFLTWTIGLVRFFAGIHGAAVPIAISPAAVVTFYALVLGVTWLAYQRPERRSALLAGLRRNLPQRVALAAGAVFAILAVAWAVSQPDGQLHVTFFDVGQGDATFIQTPSGRQILVDGGPYPSVLGDHLGREMPFWDRDVDIVVATHPDADHVAGLPGVFDHYGVGRLITNGQEAEEATYQAMLAAAAENGVPIHHARAGEVIVLDDGVRLEILNPVAGPPASTQHDNDVSVSFRLVYGDFTLLLTGDAGEEAERDMLATGRPLSAVVFKAGHHGAKSSSSADFLEAVRPQYVVISAGEGNRYGHPHPEMLQRAADVGAVVLRTDELGTIEVTTEGQAIWWQSYD